MNNERQPYGVSFGVLRKIYQQNIPTSEKILSHLGISPKDYGYKHKRAIVASPIVAESIKRLNSEFEFSEQLKTLGDASGRDSLTGLLSRDAFNNELIRATKQAKYEGSSLSVVVLDLNGLKETNDKFGHARGDLYISKTGSVLTSNTRRVDGKSIEAGRLGEKGDEFHVFLRNNSRDDALAWWERVNQDFKNQQISIAAGIAEVNLRENPQVSLELADKRMYIAKGLSKILGVNIAIAEDIDMEDPTLTSLKPFSTTSEINISDFPITVGVVPNRPVVLREENLQLVS